MCLVPFHHLQGGHLLLHEPISIVKPILENWIYRKASMPNCKNVKKFEAILSM